MHQTLNPAFAIGAVLLAFITVADDASGARSAAARLVRIPNPCLHDLDGSREALEDQTRPSIARLESASVAWRQTFSLVQWPRDSVRATTDSVVCTHLDSLVSLWMESSEGIALGIARSADWEGINAVRANPHRYIVSPPLLDHDGLTWNFVVDSVSGHVQFFRGTW